MIDDEFIDTNSEEYIDRRNKLSSFLSWFRQLTDIKLSNPLIEFGNLISFLKKRYRDNNLSFASAILPKYSYNIALL